jgi:hypothetical protein
MDDIKIGQKFTKRLNKNTVIDCEVTNIIKRYSVKDDKFLDDVEYWAKSDKYGFGKSFEVPKTTIIRGKI